MVIEKNEIRNKIAKHLLLIMFIIKSQAEARIQEQRMPYIQKYFKKFVIMLVKSLGEQRDQESIPLFPLTIPTFRFRIPFRFDPFRSSPSTAFLAAFLGQGDRAHPIA